MGRPVGFIGIACGVLLLAWIGLGGASSFRIEIAHPNGSRLPLYCFLPQQGIRSPMPAVICGVGVGGTQIPQYREHCQALANRNFFVVLVDPSNYPEWLAPSPESWDRIPGYCLGGINQAVVAGKLFFTDTWYLESIRAVVDFLCASPLVDSGKIALSGFSQPANAALTYACKDPRIRAIVWNYGGSPWVTPYDPKKLPPVLIFHGTDDEVYDVKYATNLAAELGEANRDYEVYIYPGQKHMFNIYYDLWKETRQDRPVISHSFEILVSFLYRKLYYRFR